MINDVPFIMRPYLSARNYLRSSRASAVEFVLVFPFLFIFFLFVVDFCNWLADWRQATRIAESIVRTAQALDRRLVDSETRPLSDETIQLLRNIADRMKVQLPDAKNSVWIGRYVRPQRGNGLAVQAPIVQLLPNGLSDPNNQGIMLNGDAEDVAQRNQRISAKIETIALSGEIFYAVEIRFRRHFLGPLPQWAKERMYTVQFIQ